MRIEDEIEALNAEEFVVPCFAQDIEERFNSSCAS